MENDNQLVLFDIDRTLFDTDKYLAEMDQVLMLKIGARHEEFNDAVKEYYKNIDSVIRFVPNDYLTHLSDTFAVPQKSLEDIFWDKQRYLKYRYPDVVPTLDTISRKYSVGIFSEGDEEFQLFKYRTLSITLFINENQIYIVPDKNDEDFLRTVPDDAIIIDDSLKNIEVLNQYENFKPIWINREDEAVHEEIPTIFELDQVEKSIKKNKL